MEPTWRSDAYVLAFVPRPVRPRPAFISGELDPGTIRELAVGEAIALDTSELIDERLQVICRLEQLDKRHAIHCEWPHLRGQVHFGMGETDRLV